MGFALNRVKNLQNYFFWVKRHAKKKKKKKKKKNQLEMCQGHPHPPAGMFWPLVPPRGMTLGQRYHTLKDLDVGKCHTKFQLSSPEGIKVISCKRNAVVNLHPNLQVNLNLVTNGTYAHTHVRTYARTDVTSRRNAMYPTPAKGRQGHKKDIIFW